MLTRTVFTDSAIQSAIDTALAAIPADRTVALVAHADLNGIVLSGAGRVGDHWTIQAAVIKPWTGPLSAQADVIASW